MERRTELNNKPLTETMYYILLSVLRPNYGYGIMEHVSRLTNGRIHLGAGTLYGAINILLDKRYITLYSVEKSSRKKKEYIITPLGKQVLKEEVKRLEELVTAGKQEL